MDFKKIETKWQKFWATSANALAAKDDSTKPKKYILVEFPYPSGTGLHVGHAFSFTGGDIYARYQRMKGYEVLFPMGWDAFGLPTENYAIKAKRKPQEVTKENTDMFRSQMKRLAFSFDWAREVNTTDPGYYKWTQWIFIQLFKHGLAYKKEMPINWCPSCKIGLANEEVVGGKCERCGAEVSRRNISQWVVKITDYADKLIEGLEQTKFIEKVKQAQINWIGKSEGAKIKFRVKGKDTELEVFTTRADTLFGVTFLVISPEHELVSKLENEEIRKYVSGAHKKSDLERAELQKEKTGVYSGLNVINPANGQEIPLWIADYVLMGYGTGVVMGVPGHDQRDWEFAKKYGLEIVPVIKKEDEWDYGKGAMVGVDEGNIINSDFLDGLSVKQAIEKMNIWVEEKEVGKKTNAYHLRDWIFSRQHYWGEPIPMINCSKCGWVPVPEEELPMVLPEVEAYEPTDDGQSPLSNIDSFVKCRCPVCGGEARRETDTMPNWAGSDWYFLRYLDPHNNQMIAANELIKKWMPVDVYIGGDEHNTLHLLYSRFIYKFLVDIGAVPRDIPEPYVVRMSHGVILGPDNQRMSKSRGNVVVPEVVADKYGVDVVRMYLMFIGPFEGTMAWNENTLMGVKRFIDRVESFTLKQIEKGFIDRNDNIVLVNRLVWEVDRDLETFSFNTAIAKLMKAFNELKAVNQEEMKTILKLLAPLVPYVTEELWHKVGGEKEAVSVHLSQWPKVEEKYLVAESIKLPVAINGKTRVVVEMPRVSVDDKKVVLDLVYANEKIKEYLKEKRVIKEIIVPGKMVNLVVE